MTDHQPHSQFALLKTRRFLPLFATQFLGAANDNLFKQAMVTLIIFRIAAQAGFNGQLMVTAAGGVFILPFFLFSATAGQLSDKFDKALLIRLIKLVEILAMGLGAWGFLTGNAWFLMAVLFLMGTHSTFFGPLKYAILPDHLSDDELIGGNALIEAGTFLAILLGTIGGGLLIMAEGGVTIISAVVLGVAVLGLIASWFIPKAPPADARLQVSWNIARETLAIIRHARHNRDVFLSILGISWFWLVGAVFLSQFPAFAKDILGGNEQVQTLFMVVFSVGIGIGSVATGKLLHGEISAKYVPLAAVGITVFSIDLYFAAGHAVAAGNGAELAGAAAFLGHLPNWRVLADLFLVAVSGGIYIVPLYAIMQSRSDVAHRSRTIASNNVINAGFMVVSAIATGAMLESGFTVTDVFFWMAVINIAVAAYICRLLPDYLWKAAATALFSLLYKVEVRGLENLAKAGPRVVIVVNHTSFLDAPLLAALLPDKPTFAINTWMAERWWVRPFLSFVDAFPVDPTNPLATKHMVQAVRQGRRLVIFPEGRLTVTGALMKVYEGPGLIADKADAVLLPVRIDGAQFSTFSRLAGKLRLRWLPKITITLLEPQRVEVPADVPSRRRRQMIGNALYDVMSITMFETSPTRRSLFQALLDARALHGGDRTVVEDVERKPLSYDRLVLGSLVLGRRLSKLAGPGETVGLLMPNANGAAAAFFALQAYGRVPAMLNFTAGAGTMKLACQAAQVRTVVTSRRFIEMARLQDAAASLAQSVNLVYLEDVRARINPVDKLLGLISRPFAARLHARRDIKPDQPAVVLFTSGSEGTPKAVLLSHVNLLSNIAQISSRIAFNSADKVFNALPVFHSFGLTGGLLLPVLSGMSTFLYPSPLHYRIVPELVYDTNATALFGTDTFLAGYGRAAHPYDFYSLRYVVAGAEKVKDDTRRLWGEKFGLRILEGYGATETAPVLAVNTPMHHRPGTVGRFLPGIRHRLTAIPGIERGGRLEVAGPNVMLGYQFVDRPGEVVAHGEWYDTGDIVEVDADGFVTILGRAKRFAKVAGEMVSLGAVEDLAAAAWPDHRSAAAALPDPKKGEQVVVLTERPGARRDDLLAIARARGVAEVMVPKAVLVVDAVPLLGSGKTDYPAVQKLAEAQPTPGVTEDEEMEG
jgi:acyl-[acyl-carrier-protein]-phospholipid O-acyltransferase/long-chain-fatty-acid--[acyl-carrier-protein] ligase